MTSRWRSSTRTSGQRNPCARCSLRFERSARWCRRSCTPGDDRGNEDAMHINIPLVEARVARFIDERLRPAVVAQRQPLTVTRVRIPDEPIPFVEANALDFEPFMVGDSWGAPWTTTWFHLTGDIPMVWSRCEGARTEVFVDLGFDGAMPGFQAEGQYWHPDGRLAKGVSPRNSAYRLRDTGTVDLYLEAAGNPCIMADGTNFTPNALGARGAMDGAELYRLRVAEIRLIDDATWQLLQDADALQDLLGILPADDTRRARVLHALDAMVDAVDPDDVRGTASDARAVIAPTLASPAHASAHLAYSVGHAHIDSAWLWPVRETVRKCARTFSNVVDLMDEYPDFVFACSSAQQYAWIKSGYPDLYERIREKIRTGQWVPVGGMWVESDTNMPGGEALVRQMTFGKRFFLEEFGVETRDVWLPDSFGYSGALPQLARLSGADRFLTQKLSWNETDRMPHHTFDWVGIDGSRVLTHFPPVDTYNSTLAASELDHAARNYREKALSSGSIVPFGYGDGGGGPTREMLARAERYRSLEGVARTELSSPYRFFEDVEREFPNRPLWRGEMYLEFHRGTYTSQARTKQGNRRSEALLHEAELWAATAAVRVGADYPYDELESAWRDVLLNQFHDILPGSSIEWVYRDAEATYERVLVVLEGIINTALEALGADAVDAGSFAVVNATPLEVAGVAPYGAGEPAPSDVPVSVSRDGETLLVDNGVLRIRLTVDGVIDSIRDLRADREVIAGRANLLQLFRDTPRRWDAWDIDKEYERVGDDITGVDDLSVTVADGLATIRVLRSFGASHVTQTIEVRGGDPDIRLTADVDWHESQKLLKLAFPLAVQAERSAAETQFGHVLRPTHQNTSWDAEKFEICAHRWVHVGEPGYGVAVANDRTYGHDVRALDDAHGTLVRQSLVRAPLFPDPTADQGEHRFITVLRPGADVGDAVGLGYRLAYPPRRLAGTGFEPLVSSSDPAVIVETVKLADDRTGDVVVRLYESRGGRAVTSMRTSFAHAGAVVTDLLERGHAAVPLAPDGGIRLEFHAFEIVTVRLSGVVSWKVG
ncbi:MAG: glycoside hydrolase family 38 C-terminal domain-containing protein [Microbacterium sp.]|uniref:alpha-mannosidase n=1 Tax=Microbacterium sp. TaxID=51671 RepID=UPI0039E5C525